MNEIQDIINSIPDKHKTEQVMSCLRAAYYRGAEHYSSDPKAFNKARAAKIKKLLSSFKTPYNED